MTRQIVRFIENSNSNKEFEYFFNTYSRHDNSVKDLVRNVFEYVFSCTSANTSSCLRKMAVLGILCKKIFDTEESFYLADVLETDISFSLGLLNAKIIEKTGRVREMQGAEWIKENEYRLLLDTAFLRQTLNDIAEYINDRLALIYTLI